MDFRVIKRAALGALIGFGLLSAGAIAEPADKAVAETLRKALEQTKLNLKVESVEKSEMPGVSAVTFVNGPVVYATNDGKYFVLGDLHAVEADSFVNLTERRRDSSRVELLAQVDKSDMIVYPAEGETRAHINVFTDVTCFYCQKLHLEVPQLNKMGIEVRYLAYPRAGLNSDGYRKLATAWCADDQLQTLTDLKAKKAVAERVCSDNPIEAQFQLGQQAGVSGTPAIITSEGRLIPGYKPAADLVADLGLK